MWDGITLFAETPLTMQYNIWPWFFAITPVIVVLGIRPEKPQWMRFWRLLLACALAYAFILLAVKTSHAIAWRNYNECYANSTLRYMSPERNEACHHHLEKYNDSRAAMLFFLGWVPSIAYVGFLELCWRIIYKRKIRTLGNAFKGKWFSNLIVMFFIPFGCGVLYLFGLVGTLLIHTHWSSH